MRLKKITLTPGLGWDWPGASRRLRPIRPCWRLDIVMTGPFGWPGQTVTLDCTTDGLAALYHQVRAVDQGGEWPDHFDYERWDSGGCHTKAGLRVPDARGTRHFVALFLACVNPLLARFNQDLGIETIAEVAASPPAGVTLYQSETCDLAWSRPGKRAAPEQIEESGQQWHRLDPGDANALRDAQAHWAFKQRMRLADDADRLIALVEGRSRLSATPIEPDRIVSDEDAILSPLSYVRNFGDDTQFRVMKSLLDAGARAGIDDLLGWVARDGNVEAVRTLLAFGANPNCDAGFIGKPLVALLTAQWDEARESDYQACLTLLRPVTELDEAERTGATAASILTTHVRAGHLAVVRMLIEEMGFPAAFPSLRVYPVKDALSQPRVLNYLLDRGADPGVVDDAVIERMRERHARQARVLDLIDQAHGTQSAP